jgi:hypothetical protein
MVFQNVRPYVAEDPSFAMKVQAVSFSETLLPIYLTWEDCNLAKMKGIPCILYVSQLTVMNILMTWVGQHESTLLFWYHTLWYCMDWCSCLRQYATNWKVVGLIPDDITRFFNWPNPSSCTTALGSNHPLTEMSTRNHPGVENVRAWKSQNCMGFHSLLQG